NAGGIQAVQLRFGQVADVAGDFFSAQLRVAGDNREFLDVNRGVAVVGHNLLGNQNRILEVVAVPRHEGDQHVLAERELPQIGRRTIGQHVATGDEIATLHDGTLVDVGVLVRTRVLGQVVDVDTDFT